MSIIRVTSADIIKAIDENDCKALVKILESFDFIKNEPTLFRKSQQKLASRVLGYASTASKTIDEKTVNTLIDYLSPSVDVFVFIFLACRQRDDLFGPFSGLDRHEPSEEVKKALFKAVDDDDKNRRNAKKLGNVLEGITKEEFFDLVKYLNTGKIESLSTWLTPYFIRCARRHNLLKVDLMFLYMAVCLRDPVADEIPALGELFGLLGMASLDSLIGDMEDDSTTEQETTPGQ